MMKRIVEIIQVITGWFVIIETLALMLKKVIVWNLIHRLAQYDYLLFPAIVVLIIAQLLSDGTTVEVTWEWKEYTYLDPTN